MKNLKFINLLIIGGLFCLSLANPSKALTEIGIVDEERVLSEYSASKDAQAKIADLRTKIQNLLTDLNSELEKANSNKALTEAQKAQKQKDAEKKLIEEKEKAEEIAGTLREQVEGSVQKAINDESRSQGLTAVFTKEVTLYGGKDITDAVLKRLAK